MRTATDQKSILLEGGGGTGNDKKSHSKRHPYLLYAKETDEVHRRICQITHSNSKNRQIYETKIND